MFENKFSDVQFHTLNNNLCIIDFYLSLDEIGALFKEVIDNNLINELHFKIKKIKHNKFSMSIQTNCR